MYIRIHVGWTGVVRITTGWTVRGSNPRGCEIFRTRLERPGTHLVSCAMGTPVSVPEDKAARGVGLTTHSYPAPSLKRDSSCAFAVRLVLRVLF
jgi:hypothetical protein